MKNDKNLIIKVGVVIGAIVVAIVAVFLFNNQQKSPNQPKPINEIKLTIAEESTVAMINLIIAKAELSSPQTAHVMYLSQMGNIAKRYNQSTDWFDGSKATFNAKIDKSEKQQVITLSDGSYCAEFTLREDVPSEHTLTRYSFGRKDCPGKKVMFLTTEEIDKLPKSMKE